jgi:hypothetical protein
MFNGPRASRAFLIFCVAASFAIATASAQQAPFCGDWLSDGYGYFVQIDDAQLTLFEVTPISAKRKFSAKRQVTDPELFALPGGAAEMALTKSGADGFALQRAGAASTILFKRVAKAPDVVGKEVPDDPETTFEVFWQTFAIHYPFFALRGVDWNATRAQFRPKVTKATTPAELFAIFKAMIEPLHDAHTSLRAPSINQQFGGSKVVDHPLDEKGRDAALTIIDKNYVRGRLEVGCNGHLKYGELDDKTGYLRIDGFGGYAGPMAKSGFAATLEALDTTLDAAMKSYEGKSSLVIDVRINGGGSDVLGVAVASRLTDRDYIAFTKRTRNDPDHASDGDKGWTAPQTTHVVPTSRPRFLGRVFLLTGPNSISAAETFTMALLGRTPHVTRVGESTQGVYSDVLGRDLPNGWEFGFPNEVFLDAENHHYEKRGVPPDEEVAVFAPDDLKAGKDRAIERVFELIDEG